MAEHKSSRINVEVAPGIRTALDKYIERERSSPDQAKVKITYTDVINLALKEYLSRKEPRSKEEYRGENLS